MSEVQFVEFMRWFKRATFALEVIASRELPEDEGKATRSLFGNSFGECTACGTQLVDWLASTENTCEVCGGFIREPEDRESKP